MSEKAAEAPARRERRDGQGFSGKSNGKNRGNGNRPNAAKKQEDLNAMLLALQNKYKRK